MDRKTDDARGLQTPRMSVLMGDGDLIAIGLEFSPGFSTWQGHPVVQAECGGGALDEVDRTAKETQDSSALAR